MHFPKKYIKLKSVETTIKTTNKKGTLKKFENGQLGAMARIKFSEMRKQNRALFPLTHLPINSIGL